MKIHCFSNVLGYFLSYHYCQLSFWEGQCIVSCVTEFYLKAAATETEFLADVSFEFPSFLTTFPVFFNQENHSNYDLFSQILIP